VREELRGEAFVDEALDATWEPRSDVFRLSMTKEPACETGRDENGVLAVEPAAEPDFEAKEPAFETGREVSREPAVDPAVDPPEVLSPPFLGPAAAVLPDAAVVLLSTEPLRLTPSPTVVSCLLGRVWGLGVSDRLRVGWLNGSGRRHARAERCAGESPTQSHISLSIPRIRRESLR